MDRILQIFKRAELRNKVLAIVGLLAFSRLLTIIPIPVVDPVQLQQFLAQSQFGGLLGLVSAFTGGSLSTLSIVMLGVGPYITATIIMQLLTMIFPSLEQKYKYEGEAGRAKFNQYSRLLTVPLAALQGYAFLTLLVRQGVLTPFTLFGWAQALIAIIAGSLVLMWIGELISEKNIGNGISLLIFAGIVARLPFDIQQALFTYTPDQLFTYVGFVVIAIAVIVGVVYISEAQRNVPINYARRVRGNRMFGGVSTYLPMRVNNAGVIPIIFALSILLFPTVIANFFASSGVQVVAHIAGTVRDFLQSNVWHSIFYFVLVVVFTFFYTAVTFDPKSISENIQQNGGYIPGIRPGPSTAQFLDYLLNRITLVGALFLGLIAVLPNIVQGATGVTAFTVGGTSVLIVVSVALEVLKQVDAQLSMYEY